jgi:hypothetical protein
MRTVPSSRLARRKDGQSGAKKYALSVVKSSESKVKKKKKGEIKLSKKVRVMLEEDFGKHAPRLISMLEMGNGDGALTLLKRKLLQTSIGLLPHAEKTVRESKSARGVYQFSTLVSQIREIMSDIEADRDRDLLLAVIDERVVKPAFMDFAQQIMITHFEFRKDLEIYVKSEGVQAFNRKLEAVAKELARKMQEQYVSLKDGLEKALKN